MQASPKSELSSLVAYSHERWSFSLPWGSCLSRSLANQSDSVEGSWVNTDHHHHRMITHHVLQMMCLTEVLGDYSCNLRVANAGSVGLGLRFGSFCD